MSIKLPDVLNRDRCPALLEDARRHYRAGNLSGGPPFRIKLVVPNSGVEHASQRVVDVVAEWLHVARRRVLLDELEPQATVVLGDDWSRVRLVYGKFDGSITSQTALAPGDVEGIVQLVISIAVSFAGLHRDATHLLQSTVEAHGRPDGKLAALLAAPFPWNSLVAAKAYETAFELAEVLANRGLRLQASIAAAAGLAAAGDQLASEDYRVAQRYRGILTTLLEAEEAPDARGRLYYGLANSLRASGFPREAVRCYLDAARDHPGYLDRPYWWAELAGALCLRGCNRQAIICYSYALRLDPDDRYYVGCLADVHFRLRNFKESSRLFLRWFEHNLRLEPEFLVRMSAAMLFEAEFGSGRRNSSRAHRMSVHAYGLNDVEAQQAELSAALAADPLCEYAWHNYAQYRASHEPGSAASWWICAAAVTWRWDVVAIVNAVGALTATDGPGPTLVRSALLQLAKRRYGERFFVEIRRHMEGPVEQVEAAIKALRELTKLSDIPFPRRGGVLIRLDEETGVTESPPRANE